MIPKMATANTDGFALLSERCAYLPTALREDLARPFAAPSLVAKLLPYGQRSFLLTGVGLSEGPARYLCALLTHSGFRATFVPLSSFVMPTDLVDLPDEGDTLVVFSQGLSPNANLALAHSPHFRHTLLFTAVAEDDPRRMALHAAGVLCIGHGPSQEAGLLLRVLGPPLAILAALRFHHALTFADTPNFLRDWDWTKLPAWVESAKVRADDTLFAGGPGFDEPLRGPLALVTCGGYGALCHGLSWKFLEGLRRPAPPILDVLQVAHGPLQQFFDGPMTLLALERPHHDGDLFDRLAAVLKPTQHRLVRLLSLAPSPLSYFDHDAQCNHLLLRALTEEPCDLQRWPARGLDGPLYDLGVLR